MLIVGGYGGDHKQVEIISPTTGTAEDCTIQPLPEGRVGHTFNKGTVCGGYSSGSSTSCIRIQPDGGWAQTITLKQPRLTRIFQRLVTIIQLYTLYVTTHNLNLIIPILSRRYHSSFSTKDGIVILGGVDSPSTAEFISDDKSTSLDSSYLDYPVS